MEDAFIYTHLGLVCCFPLLFMCLCVYLCIHVCVCVCAGLACCFPLPAGFGFRMCAKPFSQDM